MEEGIGMPVASGGLRGAIARFDILRQTVVGNEHDARDQSEILKYYKTFLTNQESTFLSVRTLKNGRSTMKIFPLKNSGLKLQIQPLLCNPQIFPATHKILAILLTTPRGRLVFL